MKIKSGVLYFLFLFIITTNEPCFAQAPSFSATVSNAIVPVGDQFQITFTLNSSGDEFSPPPFRDFNVLSGPNQSTSMQIMFGKMLQSISFSYILQTKTEGSFKIGPAAVTINGKLFYSNPVVVTVVRQNKKTEEPAEEDVTKNIGKNLFIKAIVDKTTIYQGEGIHVTYKLFSKVNLVNLNLTKVPELNGFWNQEYGIVQQVQLVKENIDGVEYNTSDLKKMILFPQRSGTLQLDPMEMGSVVRVPDNNRRQQSSDPFENFLNDPFFGGASRYHDLNFKIVSKPVNITVIPLPPNAPEGFSGAVGVFSMNAFIDKPTTKTNEPVNLKIKISGKGNIKLIDPIKVNLPSDIESYAPKTADNITVNGSGVSGSRAFEYLLIPRHPGEFKIAPIHFSYFDPAKKKYVDLESPAFTIKVEKGSHDVTSNASASGVSKEELQILSKDIRYIKTNPVQFGKKGAYFFQSVWYYICFAFPVMLFFAFLVYRNKQKELNSNTVLLKSKRATQVAKKRLVLAHQYLKENNKEKFHDEILKSIWGYTSDKLDIPLADLSKNTATSILRAKHVKDELINKYSATIDHCEFARYAPAGSSATMENIYEDTMQIISQIEQELK